MIDSELDVDGAATYAERYGLQALLIVRHGETLAERYAEGFDRDTPHALYSGTKSFWGILAVAASEDGVLSLDEPVGATFPLWRVGLRSRVTLRMLLQLTSGIGFGGLGNAVPTYPKALEVEPKDEPGSRFTYGGIPLQIFGAVLAEKLASRGTTPHAYLRARILNPAGCPVASWRTLHDGTHPLPTGASLSARAWSAYGTFVTDARFAACLRGSPANPRYGLGWWLLPLAEEPSAFYASGSGGQALYVLPSRGVTIVKFAKSRSSFAHATFVKRLLRAETRVSARRASR